MKLKIEKATASGKIIVPPSKSMAHRYLIAAALSEGVSNIYGISKCKDVLATIDCLEALGVKFCLKGNDVTVNGVNIKNSNATKVLFCRESGSTLRFLIPLAMLSQSPTTFEGADTLMTRPMTVYENLFTKIGLLYKKENNTITVCGPLKGGEYCLPGDVSSQFISGLLFALPLTNTDSIIRLSSPVESRSYIDLTLSVLNTFGIVSAWADETTLTIKGCQSYKPSNVTVEADASGAAFTDALNLFGGNVTIGGSVNNSLQGDAIYPKLFAKLSSQNSTISLANCPDLAPILFAIAAAKHGGTFLDTRRLKIKESDRAEVMAEELRKFGTKVTVNDNSVIIDPNEFHAPDEVLYGHNDHRIVMALSILLTLTGGEIEGAEAVSKSYPEFFDHLKHLKIEVKKI